VAKKLVKVMNTAFRDGFQSVFGARVFTKDFIPAVEASRDAGITHFEAGGGARYQSLYFYCNEDAFDMMDAFREAAGPDANLQTLARGINVVALDSQPKSIIKLHAQMFKKHGMTTIRNFDALNDVNNLIYSGQCIVEAGLKHEVVVTMMELPPGCSGAHTAAFYVDTLKAIIAADIPFDSVCFKDASGTSVPSKVYETIKMAREILPVTHMRLHTHDTAGTSVACYRAALDAGVDGIDLSMAPCSGGTSQPDMATMWHALRGTDYELDFDIDKIMEAEMVFKECMADYFMPPEATQVEPLIPWSPMPGGALTANTQMMRDNGIMDRYNDVIAAMEETVRKGGFGTSVTPVSQFYFQQAFNNVMFGPWEKFAPGYGKMVLGYFGKTPVAPDPEIVKLASKKMGLAPTTRNPLDINEEDPNKGIAPAKKRLEEAGLPTTDENIFISASCEDKGINFLLGKATTGVRKIETTPAVSKADSYTVTVNNVAYGVQLNGDQAVVNGTSYDIDVKAGIDSAAPTAAVSTQAGGGSGEKIQAPLPGSVFKIVKNIGDTIAPGDTVLILEAMKMESEIKSTNGGSLTAIYVAVGDQVSAGQVLAVVS